MTITLIQLLLTYRQQYTLIILLVLVTLFFVSVCLVEHHSGFFGQVGWFSTTSDAVLFIPVLGSARQADEVTAVSVEIAFFGGGLTKDAFHHFLKL